MIVLGFVKAKKKKITKHLYLYFQKVVKGMDIKWLRDIFIDWVKLLLLTEKVQTQLRNGIWDHQSVFY